MNVMQDVESMQGIFEETMLDGVPKEVRDMHREMGAIRGMMGGDPTDSSMHDGG